MKSSEEIDAEIAQLKRVKANVEASLAATAVAEPNIRAHYESVLHGLRVKIAVLRWVLADA